VIGLDTNVILRMFDFSDRARTQAAETLIATGGESGGYLVNPIVLAEFAWTLDRTYKLDRSIIADHLDRILQASELCVPFLNEAEAAARQYRKGPADFADYFLSEINHTLGCRTTVTFDRDAGKGDRFTLLAT
jgi:predicted nucleic-acid-binding protein